MSLGGGHIFDMVNKMKTNLDMIKGRQFFKVIPGFTDKKIKLNLLRKPVSDCEKSAIQNKLNEENRSNLLGSIAAFGSAIILVGVILYYLLSKL